MLLKNFNYIRKSLGDFERNREEAISKSREVIKLSKQIIYSLHRNDFRNAGILVKKIKGKVKGMSRKHYDTTIVSVAFQEYVEAVCYYEFLKNKRLPSFKDMGIDAESYLMGLCDLTGELVRRAVNDVIKKRYGDVYRIKDFVEELYWEFLKIDIRSNDLRRKADAIKWNLKKLDELVLGIRK
jgi:translin